MADSDLYLNFALVVFWSKIKRKEIKMKFWQTTIYELSSRIWKDKWVFWSKILYLVSYEK